VRGPDPTRRGPEARRDSAAALGRAAAGLGVALGTGTLGLLAAGWRCAGDLLDPARAGDPYALEVVAVDGGAVTLPATDDTLRPGRACLQWPGGYGLLGEACERTPAGVRRSLSGRVGAPLAAGVRTRIKRHAYEGDPRTALGLPFEDVAVPGPLGPMPAWLVPASDEDRVLGDRPWAVLVHGRGSTRMALLRLVRETHALGLTTLVVTYRNDAGAPASPDGLFHLGDTEWLDLEAAVREAQRRGARRIVAFGDSMGGAIVLQLLQRSNLAGSVRAVVLDCPVLDWDPVLALAAEQRRLPPLLTAVARCIVRLRTGLRWERLDQVRRAVELTLPILLIHGDADAVVPVATSDALAAARPDLVTYVRVPGAGHAESWTVDRPRCAEALAGFLGRLTRPPASPPGSRAAAATSGRCSATGTAAAPSAPASLPPG
jgi:alpha-beta hydrolase superfamily lysophospholipase